MTSIGQHTALEGYKMSRCKHYDLFVFDVRMSPLPGTELAEGLKQESPGTNIILISAFADEALRSTAQPRSFFSL
jgi:YesN/AraC family two-component response regulator